jgi:hypothetical protein
MQPPGTGMFPFEIHHPRWFRELLYIFVGDDSLERLHEKDIERDQYADVVQHLALPPGHPANIYHWPAKGRTVKAIGRLPGNETTRLVHELVNAGAFTVTAWDTSDNWHVYPPLK